MPAPAETSAAPITPTAPSGRLPNGELCRQVALHLDEAPGDTFTAGEIARALGRSSGPSRTRWLCWRAR